MRRSNSPKHTELSSVSDKEATARIKINKLLEAAGWRFFAVGDKPANARLEPSVTIKASELNALGDNFEKTSKEQTRGQTPKDAEQTLFKASVQHASQ